MAVVSTNLRNTRESARQLRVEPTGIITATNVQKALEELSVTPQTLTPTPVGASPYNVLITDTLLYVDTAAGPVTINLQPTALRFGRALTIKDVSGHALANNITLVPSGAETIDGLPTYVVANEFGGVRINPTAAGYGVAP